MSVYLYCFGAMLLRYTYKYIFTPCANDMLLITIFYRYLASTALFGNTWLKIYNVK